MARLIGEAFVAVSPDTKAFREKTAAELKKALQGIDAKVNMSPETSKLKVKVEAAAKEASKGATARIAVDLRSDQVRAASLRIKALVDDLSAKVARIRVDTEDKEANVKFLRLFANIEALNAKAVRIKTDADVASAFAKLAGLSLEADKLAARHEKMKVDVDEKSLSRLGASFSRSGSDSGGRFRAAFANMLGDSGGGGGIGGVIRKVLGKAGDDGGGSGGSNAGTSFMKRFGSSVVMQSPGITALVVAGLAALPAALGIVAAGAGLALGGGLMAAAMLEIKKQTKALDKQIKQLTGKKNPTAADKQALVDLNNQQAALQKQAAAYNKVNTALANLKSSFLSFAAATTKPLIKPFADALQRIADLMRGPWVGIFRNLFAASAPLVRPFLDMLTNLVDTILPAFTQVLNKAGKPIGDLVRNLGLIVGTKIGDWFKAAIPYIRDSGTYLSGLVSVLGSAGTFLVKFGGSAARVFMAMAPLFKQLGQSAGFLGAIFFNVIVPAIIKLVGPLSQVVAEVLAAGGAFAKVLLPVLVPIADGVVQIVAGVLKFVAAHPGLVTAITDIAIAWKLLSLAFSLSPFGAIITAIVVAAALIVHYRKQIVDGLKIAWNTVKNITVTVWNAILGFFKHWWPLLIVFIAGPLGVLIAEIVTHWHAIANVTRGIWGSIFNFFKGIWGHIENVFTDAGKSISNWARNAWNSVFHFTVSIWNHIHNWLKTWWTTLLVVFTAGFAILIFAIIKYHNDIKNFIVRIWNNIFGFFKGIWGHIENVFTDAGKSISNWAVTTWTRIYAVTSSWWNRVFAFFKGVWGHIENVFTGAGKAISNWAVTTWSHIYSATSGAWNKIFAFFKGIWGHIENVVTGTLKPIQSAISGAWNWISSTTKNVWGHIANVFTGIWNGIKNTTVSAVDTVKRTVAGAWNSIASTTANIWRKIGSFMADGVNAGRRALSNAINFVTQNLLNPIIKGYNVANNIWSGADIAPIPAVHLAKGGKVPGYAPGSDTVPAMLSPGEFVVNPVAAKAVGYDRLRELNEAKPGANVRTTRGGMDQFVNGGQILADAVKWNGHPYHWGGPSNPQQGWDCSSFVGYILGHDFGLALPGGAKWSGSSHGPVASSYNNEPGFRLVSHNTKDIQAGDLLVENSGGHVGFGVGPDRMFSAFSTASGTIFTNASNMTNIYRMGAGGGVFAGAIPGIAGAVNPAQQKAYNAYLKLLDKDIRAYSPLSDLQVIQLAKGAAGRAHLHATQGITDHPNYNFTAGNVARNAKPAVVAAYNRAVAAASLMPGGNPSPVSVSAGSNFANLVTIAKYFASIGYGKAAAAGIAGNVFRECVTLDAMILTQRGWLKHDEVVPGDKTVGYNPRTGRSQWTRITRVMHYDDAPVVTYGNQYWNATFTANHRWLVQSGYDESPSVLTGLTACPQCGYSKSSTGRPFTEQGLRGHMAKKHGIAGEAVRNKKSARERHDSPELKRFDELSHRDRLVLAVPATTETRLDLSNDEAALLGWIAGDGTITPDGRTFIFQSKQHNFAYIEACLPEGKFTHTTRGRVGKLNSAGFGSTKLVEHVWYLRAAYCRDLLVRSQYNPKTQALELVTAMSNSQRRAWLKAMIAAEGHVDGSRTTIYQNEGNIADAIELAAYLEGYRPSRSKKSVHVPYIGLTAPYVGGYKRRSFTRDAGRAAVWCVTTELGSWTARNDSGVFLTGNSGGNPESVGSGGNGLIGWTPARPGIVTGNASRDLGVQMPMIQQYNRGIGSAAIAHLNSEKNPWNAALYYMNEFEKPRGSVPGSDTAVGFSTAAGAIRASMAQQVYAAMGGANATALANTPVGNTGPRTFGGKHLALGGQVPGYAPGSDVVPAMLSPGEFVINPVAARAVGYDALHALNSQKFAKGGVVSPLQGFEKSVAQMTQAGRLSKLKSLVSLTNTEHNHLANFRPRSASWNSLEHLISLHKQEIAFLEKTGTHLPSPPSAPRPKAKVFPAGPVGAFERKIDSLAALVKSWQARAASAQKSLNAAGFVDAENHVGSITDALNQEQGRLSAFQAKQAALKVTPKMRATARRQAAFNSAVAAIRLTATLKTPQQKAAYWSSPYFGRLADDLMHHSTRPYSIGGASSAAIHGLALGASPDLLNAVYSGDWGSVSALLRTSDSKQFGVFRSLANTRKKRLATGGVISGKALGFDVKTGTPFTLGESGRERVMPEQAMNRYEQDKPMTSAQAERLISAVTQLARTTQAGNESTVSALTGMGRGVHRTR